MFTTKQLVWVQRNRAPRDRIRHAGEAARVWFRAVEETCFGPAFAAANALASVGDTEFLDHCRVARLSGRTLTLHVDAPGLVYSFRQQWTAQLERIGSRLGREGRFGKVIFQHGKTGLDLRLTTLERRSEYQV